MKIYFNFYLENVPIQELITYGYKTNDINPRYKTIYTNLSYNYFINIPDEIVINKLKELNISFNSEDDLVDLYYDYLEDSDFKDYIQETYVNEARQNYLKIFEENKY